jgi:hypothetical protein
MNVRVAQSETVTTPGVRTICTGLKRLTNVRSSFLRAVEKAIVFFWVKETEDGRVTLFFGT